MFPIGSQIAIVAARLEAPICNKDSVSIMQTSLKKLYMNVRILREEAGQDLIEYVLIIAIIAFAATVGMGTVASKINDAFGNIGNKMSTYVT